MKAKPPTVPYRNEIRVFCKHAVKALKPRIVLLYGSLARGDFHEGSDADILVVSDNIPRRPAARWRLLDRLTPSTLPSEVLAYTAGEFEAMIEERHPTALSALEEGQVLYDDGFYRKAQRAYRRVRKRTGLRRTESGWVAEKLLPASLRRGVLLRPTVPLRGGEVVGDEAYRKTLRELASLRKKWR